MRCCSCEVLMINGFRCHETGCPAAWKDQVSECKECGSVFEPDGPCDRFCSADCEAGHWGLPCPCDE